MKKTFWGRRTGFCSLERGRLARRWRARRPPGPRGGAPAPPNLPDAEDVFDFEVCILECLGPFFGSVITQSSLFIGLCRHTKLIIRNAQYSLGSKSLHVPSQVSSLKKHRNNNGRRARPRKDRRPAVSPFLARKVLCSVTRHAEYMLRKVRTGHRTEVLTRLRPFPAMMGSRWENGKCHRIEPSGWVICWIKVLKSDFVWHDESSGARP